VSVENRRFDRILNALLKKQFLEPVAKKHIAATQEGHRCRRLFTADCGEVLQFCIALATDFPDFGRP